MSSSAIVWTSVKRNISELKGYKDNPRRIDKDKYAILLENIKTNGYTNRLIVNHKNVVLGGNQRLRVLKELGYTEVDVLISNVPLTKEQEDRINITDNLSAGDWDYTALSSNFDVEQLVDWGMPQEWLIGDKPESEAREVVEKKTKLCPSCGEILN
jgi:ParB-like chromosome segregation protein Spo0J